MGFLAPAALFLGLLAAPIILLYMLRLRRREQTISSTLLWRALTRDRAANAPWQKLRRNLLLLLQLLILAALVLALARPFLRSAGRLDGNLIVLLDASASMTATDGEDGATRFEGATGRVEELIDRLGGNERMTLIAVGSTPAVLAAATNDRRVLRSALESAAPEASAADWPAAFALATGSSQGFSDPRTVIISDGQLPDGTTALPGEVTFIPVGRSGENLAISALGSRRTEEEIEVVTSVANVDAAGRQALISLYADDELLDSRRLNIEAGESAQTTWTLLADAGIVEARLESADGAPDYLPLDDRAWAAMGGQGDRRVLLASEGNLFLERFFDVLPGYEVIRAAGENSTLAAGDEPYDLYVFDGVPIPDPLPPGNILIVNPQPGGIPGEADPEITVGEVFTNTAVTRLADDPLLADVDWGLVNIAEAATIDAPQLRPLVESEGGPLLLAGEIDGRRVAILPFDLRRSDLPLQIAFPVMMANITAWLGPGSAFAAEGGLSPGATVTLVPSPRAETILVTLPNGEVWEQSVEDSAETIQFADTQQPGIYSVAYVDESGESHPMGRFAVNFFDPQESHIQPVETIRIGQTEVSAEAAGVQGRRELWPWLLLAGLILLLTEWWITYRRGTGRPFLRFR